MLTKEDCLFNRDEEGNLIGKKVKLELLEGMPEIIVKPITRGTLNVIYQMAKEGTQEEKTNADNEVIEKGLIEPSFTKEEIKDMKPKYAGAISTAIMSVSLGIEQKDINDKKSKVLMNQESELKKK